MAKRTQHTIGLDIGTSKVTCIAGEPGEGNLLEVVGIGEAEARGLRKGVIVNPDAAVDAIKKAVEEAERMSGLEANDRALADDLAIRRAEVSGVNLDEELSRLVLYQQAYSVSARLISITNELFDDLLAIAG